MLLFYKLTLKEDSIILFVYYLLSTYNNYISTNNIPNKHINNDRRFRDYGSLKAVLRSIDLYAPWINNVYLVVQSESQVPDWVNRDIVKIVLHEDFIPKEYLPTFNCNTIETHLHLIPGLSEKFIYFNDDTVLNNMNYPEDYFIGDKCVNYIICTNTDRIINNDSIFYQSLRFSNTHKLYKTIGTELSYTYFNSHGPTPLLKSVCAEIYNKININPHISAFREKTNLTQELFTIYALYRRKLILLKNSRNRNYTLNKSSGGIIPSYIDEFKLFFLDNDKYKTICVNDVFENDDIQDINILLDEIRNILNIKFNKMSKYENSSMCN